MDELLPQELPDSLISAATSARLSLSLEPSEPRPLEIRCPAVYEVGLPESRIYILPGTPEGASSVGPTTERGGASGIERKSGVASLSTRWLRALGATEVPVEDCRPLEEYLVARAGPDGRIYSYTLSSGDLDSGTSAGEESTKEEAGGFVVILPGKQELRSEAPADLLPGRALLDENSLEKSSGMSWLLVRCERVGFTSRGEARKLLGEEPGKPRFYEKSSKPVLGEEALTALSDSAAGRLKKAFPSFHEEGGESVGRSGYLLLLYRITRGEAAGALRSSRLLYAAPLRGLVPARGEGFRQLIVKLLELQVGVDPEAGISWLRLLAPRRYQYLKPSPSSLFLYRTLVSLTREGLQRAFGELRRDRRAFRSLGQILAVAPRFDSAKLFEALSPRQRELLLPRHVPRMAGYQERLSTLLDALRTIEEYAQENPSTAARPGMELFRKIARERFRRLRARVEASVAAGVYSLLFEHARLGWLQRAWSRLDRREMVRALALEPPRVVERAGMLYSRRGRLLLREDAEAAARRATDWDPGEIPRILQARRRLWPILMEQLFDAESCERYVVALTEKMELGGLPAAEAALTLLRLEEVRPGSVGPKRLIPAAARVAAEPALDEESESHLIALLEEPRLLRQGGSRFAWLLAHALERMGRPEAAAQVLELLLRQLAAKGEQLPPDEQRRAKRLGRKYKELTS